MIFYLSAFAVVILAIFGYTRSHNASNYWNNMHQQWLTVTRGHQWAVNHNGPREIAEEEEIAMDENVTNYAEDDGKNAIILEQLREIDLRDSKDLITENRGSQPILENSRAIPAMVETAGEFSPLNLTSQKPMTTLSSTGRSDSTKLYNMFLQESILYGQAKNQMKQGEEPRTPADANRPELPNTEELDRNRMYFGESNVKYQSQR